MNEFDYTEPSPEWLESKPVIGDDVLFSHQAWIGLLRDDEREYITIMFYFQDISQNDRVRKVDLQLNREDAKEFANTIMYNACEP